MSELDKNITELKILLSEEEIKNKIKQIANQIELEFPENEEIYFVCVLKGAVMFCSELIKHIKNNIQLEFIRLSSYGNDLKSSQNINAIDLNLPDLNNKNIVIVEDIIDTGLTAKFLKDLFYKKYSPKKQLFVSLLNKRCARKIEIEPDFCGFETDDKFVVGYGLDYKGYFRNLPYIGYFNS